MESILDLQITRAMVAAGLVTFFNLTSARLRGIVEVNFEAVARDYARGSNRERQ